MKKTSKIDRVIAQKLLELDQKHANHQTLYRFYHGKEDEQAKYTHKLLVSLCEEIRVDFMNEE